MLPVPRLHSLIHHRVDNHSRGESHTSLLHTHQLQDPSVYHEILQVENTLDNLYDKNLIDLRSSFAQSICLYGKSG